MKCQFCEQDVDDPCHDAQDIQQRASNHINRCGNALKRQQSGGDKANSRDDQGIVFG